MDWKKADGLLEQAIALPQAMRPAFLAEACGDDTELLRFVSGLAAESEADPSGFLRSAINRDAAEFATAPDAPATRQGQRVGPYRIQSEVGRGGMGEVYLATRDDESYEQRVALKVVRAGVPLAGLADRFRQERQILARLQHPNVVRLLDGGSTPDGFPFLAMDFVDGVPITEYCDTHKLDAKARCALMLPVCDAVGHAHQHLVVHRDIKPANILVTADGVPKLLDFGIAKLLSVETGADRSQTETGWRPLTPDYASPEQVSGAPITTATDVHQLGAVLYRLLTGRRPSDAGAHTAPGEAGLIASKAMHPDPSRKYESVRHMAADLRALLENRPIQARADSIAYRAAKWVRRSPIAAAAVLVAVLASAVGVGTTLYQARRAERRFQQVRALANTVVFEFDEKIKNLVGSTSARGFVVETAIRYLDSLERESGGDPELMVELSAAYGNIGMIQGVPSMANLGKSEEALASFDKAITLARGVLAKQPGHRGALRCLVYALANQGQIQYFVRRNPIVAKGLLEEAQRLSEKLATQSKPTPLEVRAMVIANKNLGDFLTESPALAIPYLNKALDFANRGFQESGDSEYRVVSVGVLIGLARAHREMGNTPEWARRFHEGVSIVEEIRRSDRTKESTRRQLQMLYQGLGEAYGNRQRFHLNETRKAVDFLNRSLELANVPLLAPATRAFERALSEFALGETATGPEALAHANAALAAAEELLRLDPKHRQAKHLQSLSRRSIAGALINAGQAGAAAPILQTALEELRAALLANPADLASLDGILHAFAASATARCALRDWDGAEAALKEGERRAAEALAKHPGDLYFLRDHARIAEVSGDYHRLRGEAAAGVADYQRARDMWRAWSKLAPWGPYGGLQIAALDAKIANPADKSPAGSWMRR